MRKMSKKAFCGLAFGFVVTASALSAGCAADADGDGMVEPGAKEQAERLVIEEQRAGGDMRAKATVDGVELPITVITSGDRRELTIGAVERPLVRWSLDPKTNDLRGEVAGKRFGTLETKDTDSNLAFWDAVREMPEADTLRRIAAVAGPMTNDPRNAAVRDALSDVKRVATFLDNIGQPLMAETDDPTSDSSVSTPGGERLTCSQASGTYHSIQYVRTFTSYCRLGHYASTTRPSGACVLDRCVQYVYPDGQSASGVYCNPYGQGLSMDHVVPRGGGAWGLWSKHWSAAGMIQWLYREARCY